MRLARLFQKNFLFQRGEALSLWGEASSPSFSIFLKKGRETIRPASSFFCDGRFEATFPPQEGGFEPYSILLEENGVAEEIGPIYCGDLYLGVGQSNLAVSLAYMEDKAETLEFLRGKGAKILNLFDEEFDQEGHVLRPFSPRKEIHPSLRWQNLEGDAALSSSGLLCLLAKELCSSACPIGFINASVGGISIDSLLPKESIEGNPEIKAYLLKSGKYQSEGEWNRKGAANYTQQSGFFNEKIAPLKGLKFKAVLYYQGENSCFDFDSASYFSLALKELIRAYRRYLGSDLDFYVCGIADEYYPYGDGLGCLYIQEVLAAFQGEGVTYIPVFDVEPRWLILDGNRVDHPIHTVNKSPVARRIAYAVRQKEKGRADFSFPSLAKWEILPNKIVLTLKLEEGDSLEIGKAYFGFTLAEKKGIFLLCEAKAISENEIELSSPLILHPTRFAYAFTHYSYLCDCKTKNGLPLPPCRNFSGTIDKKEMDLSFVSSSFRFLSLRENNFGSSVGGGFPIPLYGKGKILPNPHGEVSLSKGVLRFDTVSENASYFYSGLSLLLGPSGLFPRLVGPKCLTLDLKTQEGEAEFLGALFRIKGGVYRFPNLGSHIVSPEFQSYSISLDSVQDGSEGPAKLSQGELEGIAEIELQFRFPKEGPYTIFAKDLRPLERSFLNENKPSEKGKIKDASLTLPGGKP